MADIPYAEPRTVDLEHVRPSDFNSEVAGRGLEEVGNFFEKMDVLKRNKQMADGELASDQALTAGMTKIQEGKDYDNGPLHFANAVETQKQAIMDGDYEEPVKQHLLHDLGVKQAQYGAQIAAWSYSGQMSNAKDTLNTYVTTMRDQYANSTSDFQRATIKAKVAMMVNSNVGTMLTPQTAADIMEKINGEYDDNAAALDVTRDPATALKRLQDTSQYKFLDGKQRAEYIDRARNQIKAATDANEKISEGAAQDQIDSALTYGKYDVAKFQSAIGGLKPEMQKIANKRLALSLDAHSANIAISRGTPQERADALAKYEPKAGADDFAFRENMYEKLQSLASDVDDKLAKDPAGVVQDQIDRSLPIPQQIEQSLTLQEKMGATAPRILTDEKAKDYAQQYNSLPPDQKPAFVTALRVKTGQYFGQASAEMYRQGMKPSFMFANRPVDVMTKLATLDAVGDNKLKEGVGETTWKALSDSVRTQFAGIATTLPPGAPGQNAQAQETFLKLAAYYQTRGDANPVQHANTDLFGDYVIKGDWRFPSNVTGGLQDNVQAYAQKFVTDIPNIATPPGMTADEYKSIIASQGKFILAPDNFHYYVYLNGDRVRTADGKPVAFDLKDGVSYKPPVPKPSDSAITSLGP